MAPCLINAIPYEIIEDVVARVAASNVVDLSRCKLSCKMLNEIGKDSYVLQQVSLESFYEYLWRHPDEARQFIEKCQESCNCEALFQLGIEKYFSKVEEEEGVRTLEEAAKLGHKAATYVLGIIFLCGHEHERRKTGVSLIMEVFKARAIVECRKKVCEPMSSIWMNNARILQNKPYFECPMKEEHKIWWKGWNHECYDDEDLEQNLVCETCRCDHEITFFFKLLPSYVVNV